MAAIDFPNDPDTGDSFSQSGKTWVYNGDAWSLVSSPTAIPAGSITTGLLADDSVSDVKIKDDSISESKIAANAITSTKLATGATNDYVLMADSSTVSGIKWSSIPTINALDDIADVAITTASPGQVLQWDGASWVNAAASSDLMTDSKNAALIVMDIGV